MIVDLFCVPVRYITVFFGHRVNSIVFIAVNHELRIKLRFRVDIITVLRADSVNQLIVTSGPVVMMHSFDDPCRFREKAG